MTTRSLAPSSDASTQRILTVPNVLSLARLLTVPIFLWLFLNDHEEAAVILYAVGAMSDFLDGLIARRFHQVSELGKLLDPLADRVFILALAIALVARGTLPWWLATAVILRDVLVLSLFPILERRGMERLQVNFTGKTATASLLFGLTWLAISETSYPVADYADEVGMAFTILGAVLYWVAGAMYAREAARRMAAMGKGNHA